MNHEKFSPIRAIEVTIVSNSTTFVSPFGSQMTISHLPPGSTGAGSRLRETLFAATIPARSNGLAFSAASRERSSTPTREGCNAPSIICANPLAILRVPSIGPRNANAIKRVAAAGTSAPRAGGFAEAPSSPAYALGNHA